jgi:hypothetical protein
MLKLFLLALAVSAEDFKVVITGHNYHEWWTHVASQLDSFGLLNITVFVAQQSGDCIPNTDCFVDRSDWTMEMTQKIETPQGIFGSSAASKWYWMSEFAREGYNVLYIDSDVAFSANPLLLFDEPFDIAALSDLLEDRAGCHNHKQGPCASSGIVAVRPTMTSISFLYRMTYVLKDFDVWEQDLFNRLLFGRQTEEDGLFRLVSGWKESAFEDEVFNQLIGNSSVDFTLFDTWKAANCRVFRNHLQEDPARAKQSLIAMHLGYVRREDKRRIFDQYGVLRKSLDERNTFSNFDTDICRPDGIWASPKF